MRVVGMNKDGSMWGGLSPWKGRGAADTRPREVKRPGKAAAKRNRQRAALAPNDRYVASDGTTVEFYNPDVRS